MGTLEAHFISNPMVLAVLLSRDARGVWSYNGRART
jgi:hypothetical protein